MTSTKGVTLISDFSAWPGLAGDGLARDPGLAPRLSHHRAPCDSSGLGSRLLPVAAARLSHRSVRESFGGELVGEGPPFGTPVFGVASVDRLVYICRRWWPKWVRQQADRG